MHPQGQGKGRGKEQGAQAGLPDPADGVLHGRRIERPQPEGPALDACGAVGSGSSEATSRDRCNGEDGERAEERVQGEQDPGRGQGVDAGELENEGHQQRIEWGDPCRRAGMTLEGVREAVAGGQRARDAAHLPAELEVVGEGSGSIGVGEGEIGHPHQKGHPKGKGGLVETAACALLRDVRRVRSHRASLHQYAGRGEQGGFMAALAPSSDCPKAASQIH